MTNKNKVKLHVGYVGITRDGERVEVNGLNNDIDYPFQNSDNGYTFCSNGKYWKHSSNVSRLDIVGPWVGKEEEEENNVNYNDGNWHRWSNGDRPVHRKTTVAVVLTYNTKPLEDRAGAFSWNHDMDPILAFRVDKEYVEPVKPQEFWVSNNDGYAHDSLESVLRDPLTEKHGYTHVREVMDE